MHKAFRSLTLMCAVTAIAVLLTASLCQAGMNIKYSDHDPPGGVRTQFLQQVWLPEIVKQTGGKVKFQDFWGGALLGASESLKGTADGVTNMAFVFPEFYPKQLVAHQVFKLFPTGPAKWETLRWFYAKAYEEIPELKAELKKWNQMPLLATAGLPAAFCSTKPISKVEDLKGNKWRASSRWMLAFLKNAGATPVSVPWADCYMALQTGTIHGVLTNFDGMHMTKLDEAGPNVMVAKELWWATPFLHTVNLDFWNGLPKDIQDGILKASAIASEKFAQTYSQAFDNIVAAEKKAGYKVSLMPKEELVEWEKLSGYQELQKEWVKEAKEQGLANAEAIMAKVKALHAQAMAKEK